MPPQGLCKHGNPLRLLHDLRHVGTVPDVSSLVWMDLRLARNLQAQGQLVSPTCFGPFGTMSALDGRSTKRLAQPITSPALSPIREALNQGEFFGESIFAHVRAAAIRRRLVSMLLVAVTGAYRRATLGEPHAYSNARLLGLDLPRGTFHAVDLRVLDTFIRPQNYSVKLPERKFVNSFFLPAHDEVGAVETLPAMIRRLHETREDGKSLSRRDPVARAAHAVTKRGVCSSRKKVESDGHKLQLCAGLGTAAKVAIKRIG